MADADAYRERRRDGRATGRAEGLSGESFEALREGPCAGERVGQAHEGQYVVAPRIDQGAPMILLHDPPGLRGEPRQREREDAVLVGRVKRFQGRAHTITVRDEARHVRKRLGETARSQNRADVPFTPRTALPG